MAKKFTRNTETVWSRDETKSQRAFRGLFCYTSSILPPFNLGSMQHNQRQAPSLIWDLLWSLLRWKPEVLPSDRKLMLLRVACFLIARHDEYQTNVSFYTRLGEKKKKLIKERYSKFIDVKGDNLNCPQNLSLLEATSKKLSFWNWKKEYVSRNCQVFQARSGVHICLIKHSISNMEYL